MHRKIIGILVCMLLVGTVLPVTGTVMVNKTPLSSTNGNTLYVGGSGEGNYTFIQDAINDSVDGDTVYVYDDSSPYVENLIVEKSITLIGEDKQTTVIDGNEKEVDGIDVLCIKANGVTVQGFTFQNGSFSSGSDVNPNCGIEIRSHNNIIKDNFIIDTSRGIQLGVASQHKTTYANNNIIEGNTIINSRYGILLGFGSFNLIKGNIISSNNNGITSWYMGSENIIINNSISLNHQGIFLAEEKNSIIKHNSIFENELGIQIWHSKYYKVYENNIFDNIKDAYIETDIIYYILHLKENLWDSNYWGQSIQPPVNIPGRFWLFFVNIILVNILGLDKFITFPFYRYDYNPASEPYDI